MMLFCCAFVSMVARNLQFIHELCMKSNVISLFTFLLEIK